MPNLDSFTILFNSDSLKEFEQELKKNEKSLDETEKKVKSLEEELEKLEEAEEKDTEAIKETSEALKKAKTSAENFKKKVTEMKSSTNGSLLQLRNNFIKLSKALGALAFVGLTIRKSLNFYEQGEQLEFLAEKTGIAVEKLQQLGNAAKRYGGTTEGTAGTIENLRQQYQDARMGNASGGVKQAYLKYGFQISSDPEKTLERLAAKMETMKSDTAKWDLAKNLGIDEGTTRLLIQGQQKYNEELKKANKYKLYTKEDIQRMRDYRQISRDIRMGIENIQGTIAKALLPTIIAIAKVIRGVTDFLSEHKGFVKLITVIVALSTVMLSGIWIFKNFNNILSILTGALKVFGKGIGAIGMALKALFANPVGLTILAITALFLLIEDFIVFLQGGESAIGATLKKMGFNVDEVRQNCLNFFSNIKDWVFKAIDWLKSLGGKFEEFAHKLKEIWDNLPPIFKNLLISGFNPLGFAAVTAGQQMINTYNESKLNSVPQGATTAYYQTQSINNNNNNNAKTMNKNIVRTVNANGQTINIYDTDTAKMVEDKINAVYQLDNGQLA